MRRVDQLALEGDGVGGPGEGTQVAARVGSVDVRILLGQKKQRPVSLRFTHLEELHPDFSTHLC